MTDLPPDTVAVYTLERGEDESYTLELSEHWEKDEELRVKYNAALTMPDEHMYIWYRYVNQEQLAQLKTFLPFFRENAAKAIVRQAKEDGRL